MITLPGKQVYAIPSPIITCSQRAGSENSEDPLHYNRVSWDQKAERNILDPQASQKTGCSSISRDSPMKMHDKFCHAQEDGHESKPTRMVPIPSWTNLGLKPSQRRYRQQASETFSADMATQPRHLGLMFIYQGNLAAFLFKINKPMQPKNAQRRFTRSPNPKQSILKLALE